MGCGETVHWRPRITREIETWLSDGRVGNNSVVGHRSRRLVLSPLVSSYEVDAQRHQHTQANLHGLRWFKACCQLVLYSIEKEVQHSWALAAIRAAWVAGSLKTCSERQLQGRFLGNSASCMKLYPAICININLPNLDPPTCSLQMKNSRDLQSNMQSSPITLDTENNIQYKMWQQHTLEIERDEKQLLLYSIPVKGSFRLDMNELHKITVHWKRDTNDEA